MPRVTSASGRSPQRPRSQSASQMAQRELPANRQTSPEALAEDLEAVVAELAEVKKVLRHGGSFLSMSGTLLQEYFVELVKKDNLLRLALSRAPGNLKSRSCSKRRSRTLSAVRTEGVSDGRCKPVQSNSFQLDDTSENGVATALLACSQSRADGSELQSVQRRQKSSTKNIDQSSAGNAEVSTCALECVSLAAVLEFLAAHPEDAKAQRVGMHTVSRLARDVGQLRPLCLAVASAVTYCISKFATDLGLNRLAVSTVGSLAYLPDVASLIANEVLPPLFSAMVAHCSDRKLQGLACEALARLVQAGEVVVVKALVQQMLTHSDAGATSVCCFALQRLYDGGICSLSQFLDVLLPITESQPGQLVLQQRAASALQCLVRVGAIDETLAKKRACSLLGVQWVHLLTRFSSSDQEEAKQAARFHADVQAVFHEEVVKHFEYEAVERSYHLFQRSVHGKDRLLEVVRCLVENLEDYQGRLKARELAWDSVDEQLAPLDEALREELSAQALCNMEAGFMEALKVASCAKGPQGEELLATRTACLRNECAALLDRKTEATQVHHERTFELRREVMLFEAVEYLELHADASTTQIRTAQHMLEMVEPVTPPEAVVRLRARLDRLSNSQLQSEAPASQAVPAG